MLAVNLIPVHRKLKRQRAVRVSRWLAICVLYTGSVVMFCIASSARPQVSNRKDLEAQIQTVNNEIETTKQDIEQLRQKVDAAERAVEASEAVGPQPNWSILLRALASETGDSIVMGSCELSPIMSEEVTELKLNDPQRVEAFSLKLAGFGRTQRDVSDFVLRLEAMMLLDTVSLVSSRREPFLTDHAVAFEVRCSIVGLGSTE